MTALRLARALWPIVFLIPLSWWAGPRLRIRRRGSALSRNCLTHERLGYFIAALALTSIGLVVGKIAVARLRFSQLLDLAQVMPDRVQRAFATAGAELGVSAPRVAYLDVALPIATTVFGPVILLSRGFAGALADDELLLVARHELAHASRHHATVGVLWHLAFAALLLPGFEPLERHLHAAREREANTIAAHTREEKYLELIVPANARSSVVCRRRLGARGGGTSPSRPLVDLGSPVRDRLAWRGAAVESS